MNRSSKGFGLLGVIATVIFLVIAAVMSTSANSTETNNESISIVND